MYFLNMIPCLLLTTISTLETKIFTEDCQLLPMPPVSTLNKTAFSTDREDSQVVTSPARWPRKLPDFLHLAIFSDRGRPVSCWKISNHEDLLNSTYVIHKSPTCQIYQISLTFIVLKTWHLPGILTSWTWPCWHKHVNIKHFSAEETRKLIMLTRYMYA